MNNKPLINRIIKIFSISSVLFRLLNTWLVLFLLNIMKYGFNYNNIAFANQTNLGILIILFIIIFIVLSLLSFFVKKDNLDYLLFLLLYTICSFILVKETNNIFLIILLFLLFLLAYKYKLYKCNFNINLNNTKKNILIIIFALIMFGSIAIVGFLRYKSFNAPNFDLGVPTQNFYYLKTTLIPFSTCERDILISHFAIHISPIYYLVLPIYTIFSNSLTLQTVNALLITSAIIPIYLILKQRKLSNIIIILISLIYVLYAPAIASTFFDFHENIFLTPLLLWLFYHYEKNNKYSFYITLILILLVKEDAALYIIIFGIYMLFDNKKKWGLKTILIGLAYFILATFILNKFGEGVMSDRYDNLIYDNSGLIGIIKTIIANPGYFLNQLVISDSLTNIQKIEYLIKIFLPLGFMPFISKKWKNYILLLPILLTTMTTYPYSYNIEYHYSNGIIAFIFYLFIINLTEYKNYNYLWVCLFGSILIYSNSVYYPIENYINHYNNYKDNYEIMEKLLQQIPDNASVSASTFLVPHLANRDTVYEVYYHNNKPDIDYVVFDARDNDYIKNYETYINNGYIEYKKQDNLIIILKKSY